LNCEPSETNDTRDAHIVTLTYYVLSQKLVAESAAQVTRNIEQSDCGVAQDVSLVGFVAKEGFFFQVFAAFWILS